MDELNDDAIQGILGYVLGKNVMNIFLDEKTYRIQLVSPKFWKGFQKYFETTPVSLKIYDFEDYESKLNMLQTLKRLKAKVTKLKLSFVEDWEYDLYDAKYKLCEFGDALSELDLTNLNYFVGCNLGRTFNWGVLSRCKQLKDIAVHYCSICSSWQARTIKNLLSLNKDTLEKIYLALEPCEEDLEYDILPDDFSWPKLKMLYIHDISPIYPRIIKSDTLFELSLSGHVNYREYLPDMIEIKCPNLKKFFLSSIKDEDIIDSGMVMNFKRDLDEHCRQGYDYDFEWFYDKRRTCHPSELIKMGIIVEVPDDCHIIVDSIDDNYD